MSRRIQRIVFAVATVVGLAAAPVGYVAPASGQADEEAAPIFGVNLPHGYRNWRLISVAHEEGDLSGREPENRTYATFASFEDPDGNRWLLQEIKERLPGREWK